MSSRPSDVPAKALAAFAIQAGPGAGGELPVHRPVLTIGKGSQNELVLADDSVSTTHARLEYEAGGWRLTDLGSTNGTFVEGAKLAPDTPTPLPYGAAVRLGGVRLQFHEAGEADLEAARAQYTPPAPAATLAERRRGFRLPLWLLLVILVLLALAVYFGWLFMVPHPTAPPVTDAVALAPPSLTPAGLP
jgi:hypothetical protein